MAITFVSQKELTDVGLEKLKKEGKAGTVFVAENQREVGLLDKLVPKAATEAVEAQIPFEFRNKSSRANLDDARSAPRGQEQDAREDPDSLLHLGPSYAPVRVHAPYVQKLVTLLGMEDGYSATVGTASRRKISTLPIAKGALDSSVEASG